MKCKVAGKIRFNMILLMKAVGYARVFHVFLVLRHHRSFKMPTSHQNPLEKGDNMLVLLSQA
jgi:hypothetical protein